jgi:hypothetical protein
MLLFPNTSSRTVCLDPECKRITQRKRIDAAVATIKRQSEIRDSMTKQTPYLSPKEWWQRELRERVREVTGL